METKEFIESTRLLGGHPVLDFLNTVDWRTSDHPDEILRSYEDFIVLGKRTGIVDRTQAKKLQQAAKKNPDRAELMLERVLKVRELIYRLITNPKSSDVRRFNRVLQQTEKRRSIVSLRPGYDFKWNVPVDSLDLPLFAFIHAAAELLVSESLHEVRECGGPGCGLLFLDTSPNHMRRWCSMKPCGNRHKARLFYSKIKSPDRQR